MPISVWRIFSAKMNKLNHIFFSSIGIVVFYGNANQRGKGKEVRKDRQIYMYRQRRFTTVTTKYAAKMQAKLRKTNSKN